MNQNLQSFIMLLSFLFVTISNKIKNKRVNIGIIYFLVILFSISVLINNNLTIQFSVFIISNITILLFFYIELFDNNEFRTNVLTKFHLKILDFIFNIFVLYEFFSL